MYYILVIVNELFSHSFNVFHRDATGKFPEYPSADDGGSVTLFKEKDPAELERELKEKVGWVLRFLYCM